MIDDRKSDGGLFGWLQGSPQSESVRSDVSSSMISNGSESSPRESTWAPRPSHKVEQGGGNRGSLTSIGENASPSQGSEPRASSSGANSWGGWFDNNNNKKAGKNKMQREWSQMKGNNLQGGVSSRVLDRDWRERGKTRLVLVCDDTWDPWDTLNDSFLYHPFHTLLHNILYIKYLYIIFVRLALFESETILISSWGSTFTSILWNESSSMKTNRGCLRPSKFFLCWKQTADSSKTDSPKGDVLHPAGLLELVNAVTVAPTSISWSRSTQSSAEYLYFTEDSVRPGLIWREQQSHYSWSHYVRNKKLDSPVASIRSSTSSQTWSTISLIFSDFDFFFDFPT